MTPIEAITKIVQKFVYSKLKNNKEIKRPKFTQGDSVRTADI